MGSNQFPAYNRYTSQRPAYHKRSNFDKDTHGWLEGHLKEQNYGADFGDFQSFVKDMRQKAEKLDVDL